MSESTAAIHPAARAKRGLNELARQILERRLYAVLGTESDDGTPHLVPVMYLYDSGQVLIETGAATHKARNVAARRHATVLVQTPEASWVLGAGPAKIARGADACGQVLNEMDDITIVVTPTRRLTWDLAAFMGILATRGVDLTHADSWFLADD